MITSGSSEKARRPTSSAVRWQPSRELDCICRKSARCRGRFTSWAQRSLALPSRRRARICGCSAVYKQTKYVSLYKILLYFKALL